MDQSGMIAQKHLTFLVLVLVIFFQPTPDFWTVHGLNNPPRLPPRPYLRWIFNARGTRPCRSSLTCRRFLCSRVPLIHETLFVWSCNFVSLLVCLFFRCLLRATTWRTGWKMSCPVRKTRRSATLPRKVPQKFPPRSTMERARLFELEECLPREVSVWYS